MAYDLDIIRGKIKTLLQTVTEFAFVYDKRNANIEGFPAIIFDITNNANEMFTNVENLRSIRFTIFLITEVGVKTSDEANTILDIATKKAVEALEKKDNLQLDGIVDWIMPVEGPRDEVPGPNGSQIWQQLDLEVKVVSSVL